MAPPTTPTTQLERALDWVLDVADEYHDDDVAARDAIVPLLESAMEHRDVAVLPKQAHELTMLFALRNVFEQWKDKAHDDYQTAISDRSAMSAALAEHAELHLGTVMHIVDSALADDTETIRKAVLGELEVLPAYKKTLSGDNVLSLLVISLMDAFSNDAEKTKAVLDVVMMLMPQGVSVASVQRNVAAPQMNRAQRRANGGHKKGKKR